MTEKYKNLVHNGQDKPEKTDSIADSPDGLFSKEDSHNSKGAKKPCKLLCFLFVKFYFYG